MSLARSSHNLSSKNYERDETRDPERILGPKPENIRDDDS
jgi:hypothetical protein